MKPNEIRACIVRAETTQAAIARSLEVSPGAVGQVIDGRMRSARIEAALSKIAGRKLFGPKGKPGRRKTVWTGASA